MQQNDELPLPVSVMPADPAGQVRDGGHLVVDTLISEGVNTVFTVPGESFLPVLNALYDPPHPIHVISTRHEEGAGFAAEGWAKATGQVGVAMVTRGPGVTNISIALHTAMQDSTPLVVFVGQVPQEQKWREAFQEVDLPSYLGPIVKWAIEIPETGRIPELVRQAFKVARSGRPGPVVVGLPEDILFAAAADVRIPARIDVAAPAPAGQTVTVAAALLHAARRPVLIAGRELLSQAGWRAVTQLAEQYQLPAMTAFRRFDAFPNDNPHYVGPLTLGASAAALAPIADADVVLVLGERLDEITTGGYEFPAANAKLIHVASDASLVGTWGNDVLAVVADPVLFIKALLKTGSPAEPAATSRSERVQQLRTGYLERSTPEAPFPDSAGGVNISDTLVTIAAQAPADVAITTDAGNFAAWVARYYRFTQPKTHFAPLSGAMGYSLPAAIGVALANPARRVVALAGDGGFTMTLNELSTLKSEQLPVTVIVYVNGVHGTIMMHQQKHYPDRPVATKLTNPSFAAVAEAFGIPAWSVRSNSEFDAAFAACMTESGPALIEVHEGVERLSVWSQPQSG
jgi:acetolactate synthase-1/2/3 large subunit